MSHMTPKAVFFDLDGTLAERNQPAALRDREALQRLRENGHYTFLCTGRSLGAVYPAILELGFDGIVAGAGANVVLGDRVLHRRFLPNDAVCLLIAQVLRAGRVGALEGETAMYRIHTDRIGTVQWPQVDSPEDWMRRFRGHIITKATVYGVLSEEERQVLEPHIAVIPHWDYAELVPPGCSKADGMRRMLEAIGLTREDSIAFGDSENDTDMLAYAGIGVAMGNAPDAVKAAADRVTAPLAECGVARELTRLGLCGTPHIDVPTGIK